MNFNFKKWDEKLPDITEPYVKFSKIQMYLPMALLRQMKEPYKFDLMVDLPSRAFCLHFHPGGVSKPNYIPGQIGVSRFVKVNKPKVGVRLAVKRYSNLAGLEGTCWVGSLDGKEIPV
jgi:hypothetical protein